MKIELNTESATKESLYHLGMMLVSLSGKKGHSMTSAPMQEPSTQTRDMMNLFSNPEPKKAPSLMNMFGAEPISQSPTQQAPLTQSQENNLLNLFQEDKPTTSSTIIQNSPEKEEEQHDSSDLHIIPY